MSVSNTVSNVKLNELIEVMKQFREIKQSMNVNEMLVFLQIAALDSPSVKEVSMRTGIPRMSVSRHAMNLSVRGTKYTQTSGVGLIERNTDQENELITRLTITEKGKELLEKIAPRIP